MGPMRVPLFRPAFTQADLDAVGEVLFSGHLTTGPKCREFERQFADFHGVPHALSLNSCTAALHLALAAIDVGPGDIVFVPTLGFAADAQVVDWQGATAVFVDCEPRTLCMDPVKLRRTIEQLDGLSPELRRRFRAVIVIDYAGQMADYATLRQICRQWDLVLIEDAAHALPSSWRAGPGAPWMRPGQVADFACFSFYANKTITTGEGGMIVTRNAEWADKMLSMRLHGFEQLSARSHEATWNRQVVRMGYKYNLSDIAAALGIRQLAQCEELAAGRRRVAEAYTERLARCPHLQVPEELYDRRHAWHLYVVQLVGDLADGRRDAVMHELHQRGVQTSVHWRPLHLHEFYRERFNLSTDLETAAALYPTLISLPIFPSMTDEELDYVATTLMEVLEEAPARPAESAAAPTAEPTRVVSR